jgi:pyruvate/2-oxoglutarate dehydrogenase complex dihydrolipoamide acyltransferase (E2) component
MAAEHSPEEQEEKGFIVSDKRLFTPSGERVTDASPPEPAEPETPPTPKQEEPAAAQQPQPPPTGADAPQDLPPVDFAAFVMMLTNNVMVFLGQVPNPLTQQPQVDLAQAQHTIDIIMMLREKTRGNLTTEEDRFLQELLPQLQMAYVQAKQQVG